MKIHEVFPYLRVHDAAAAIEFYGRAFGATEGMRLTEASGRIGHAQISLGHTTIMLSDEYPEHGIRGPISLGGTTFAMHLHVDDVDALHLQAIAAGATEIMPPKDQFYGERTSKIRDPFGHEWLLGQEIEKVSPDDMQDRYTEITSRSAE